jgi:Flp pilus assembly protein TadD
VPAPARRLVGLLGVGACALAIGWLLWGRAGPRRADGRALGRVASVAELSRAGRPLIFVGLDGGDWELLDRYTAAGVMPQLASLVREGSGGTLSSIHPPLSPLIWTTMMTGRSPLDHGILDFTRFHPTSRQKEPITSDERREPAIWNMATYAGRRVAVFGLWATYPAESVNGILVSDRLFSFLYAEEAPPPGAVFPADREVWARSALARAESSVGFDELRAYLPWLDATEYGQRQAAKEPYAHPVSALRRILVETRVYHDLATQAIAEESPDLAVVYLQGTDSIGHVFAPFAPPRQGEVSADDFERYQAVPERYFRYVDTLLGEYRRLAETRGAVLMVASDHGFAWGEGRPTRLSSFAHATAAKWHRNEGIYLLWGPGIPALPGHTGQGSVEQVCATLAALLGLPTGVGVAGPPLPPVAADDDRRADYRQHYKPATLVLASAPGANAEALEKLRALGYVGAGEATVAAPGARGSTRTAGSYNNEGLLLKKAGRVDAAIAALEKALEIDPRLASALWNLSDLLFDRDRDPDRSDQLLVRAFAEGLPEGTQYLVGRAIGYQRAGKLERSLRLMAAAAAARPEEPEPWLFLGRYRVESGDCQGALDDFRTAAGLAPRNAAVHASEGLARLCLGDRVGARRSFERSLALDPDQPRIRQYLKGP